MIFLFLVVFGILSADRVLYPFEQASCRPTEYSIRFEQASCRPSECYIRLSKHCVGRQSAISDGASIMSADRVLYPFEQASCRPSEYSIQLEQALCRPTEYSIRLEQALCRPSECYIRWSKHRVGRQSAISDGASIMSAVRVLLPKRDYSCRMWT